MLERVAGIAKDAGLDYDFDALQHTNTIKAHQLLHFAKQHGKQLELKERLLSAYFVEGRHVGRTRTSPTSRRRRARPRGSARCAREQRVPRRRPRRHRPGDALRHQRRAVLRRRRQVRRLRRAGRRNVHAGARQGRRGEAGWRHERHVRAHRRPERPRLRGRRLRRPAPRAEARGRGTAGRLSGRASQWSRPSAAVAELLQRRVGARDLRALGDRAGRSRCSGRSRRSRRRTSGSRC